MKIQNLGAREQQIIEIVWKRKTCTISDVVLELRKERAIAYTTVSTVLHRLEIKGFVTKRIRDNQNIYTARTTREEFSNRLVSAFLSGVISRFGDVAINSFAKGIESLPTKDKKQLLSVLREYERKS